ncbi:MAG: minor capsid protein [Clostridia bacterium]|nr:minor capsid protein [Clostridia bacterium]
MAAKNKEYWARRVKKMQDAIKDGAYKDARVIEREYDAAIREIDTKIRAWYQRIAVNNEISYADAVKLLKKDELEEFHWTVQQYIEHGSGVVSGDWAKQLENASARVHISRLDAMKFDLQAHAEELTGKRIGVTKNAAELAYTESYYHTAYEMQKLAGVGVSMQRVDTRKLEKVLSRPWTADGQTFTARCWTDKDKLVDLMGKELTRMVATGAKPDRAIKNIAHAFETSKANAARVVMTESAFFASAAQKECYGNLNVEQYEVVGTFDNRMCDYCGAMDGKVFPLKDFKEGSTAPPFHPWCRCTTVPYFEDMKGIGERWMRNPETGKGSTVPADMTFETFKQTYLDKSTENGIMSLRADEFVPCLKDAKTGEILPTEIRDISRSELSKYNKRNGWLINWQKETPKSQTVLGVFLKGSVEPEGLIAIEHQPGGTYMAFAKAAPHNDKFLNGGTQKYIGVGGHLVAAAIEESLLHGNGGCVYGYAADAKLLKHYVTDFGAFHFPVSHEFQFMIEGKAAQRMIDTYTFERK